MFTHWVQNLSGSKTRERLEKGDHPVLSKNRNNPRTTQPFIFKSFSCKDLLHFDQSKISLRTIKKQGDFGIASINKSSNNIATSHTNLALSYLGFWKCKVPGRGEPGKRPKQLKLPKKKLTGMYEWG